MAVRMKIAALIALVLAAGCTNPMADLLEEIVYRENAATFTTSPDFNGITADTPLVMTFTKSMKPDSISLDGMLADYAEWEWSSDPADETATNTILSIIPKERWPVGDEQTLSVSAEDREGYPSETGLVTFDVLDNAVYVAMNGNDAATGTAAHPLHSIIEAEDRCRILNESWTDECELEEIRVAGGIYEEAEIIHQAGILLQGGWSADWSVQDGAAYPTVIRPDFSEVTAPASGEYSAVFSIPGGGMKTAVESVEIDIAAAPFNVSGVVVTDSSAVLTDISVTAADSQALRGFSVLGSAGPSFTGCDVSVSGSGLSYGYFIEASTLEGCSIAGSSINLTGNTYSYGIDTDSTTVNVLGCDINVTAATDARGVNAYASTLVLRNNVFTAEAIDGTESSIVNIVGMFSSMTVQNNTFVYARWGLFCDARTNPKVDNNIFFFKETDPGWTYGYGYYGSSEDSHPLTLRNNRFSGSDRIFRYTDQDGAGFYYASDQLALLETNLVAMGRESTDNSVTTGDESAYFDGDWALQGVVPAEIADGGLNLSEQFTTDKAENTRPGSGGWSLGAYQQ